MLSNDVPLNRLTTVTSEKMKHMPPKYEIGP